MEGEKKEFKVNGYTYSPSDMLGLGGYASVYLGKGPNGEEVALKMIKKDIYNGLKHMIERETKILKSLTSKYIVRLIDDFVRTNGNYCVVLEFCNGGNLQDKISQKTEDELIKPAIDEEEGRIILKEIAVAFLKSKLDTGTIIMHRDIKPENIMMHNGHVKITDFGWAKIVDDNRDPSIKESNTQSAGTPYYMSPEILNKDKYTYLCDIWSTGFMMYELLIGKMPWTGDTSDKLRDNIFNQPLEFPPNVISEQTEDLLRKMLTFEKDRLTWEQVYSHEALEYDELTVEDLTEEEKIKLNIAK